MNRTDWTRRHYYCWLCGSTHDIESHHILRGVLRKKADRIECLLRLCHRCHHTVIHGPRGSEWTVAKQLALKALHDPQNYDRRLVSLLASPDREPNDDRFTEREVMIELNLMFQRFEVYAPQ